MSSQRSNRAYKHVSIVSSLEYFGSSALEILPGLGNIVDTDMNVPQIYLIKKDSFAQVRPAPSRSFGILKRIVVQGLSRNSFSLPRT